MHGQAWFCILTKDAISEGGDTSTGECGHFARCRLGCVAINSLIAFRRFTFYEKVVKVKADVAAILSSFAGADDSPRRVVAKPFR
jgi:hypothetical protein